MAGERKEWRYITSDRPIDLGRNAAYALSLEDINSGKRALFKVIAICPGLERPRRKNPFRQTADCEFRHDGRDTGYNDIVAVDINHQAFSSNSPYGGIFVGSEPDPGGGLTLIAMDPLGRGVQRMAPKRTLPTLVESDGDFLAIIATEAGATRPIDNGSMMRGGLLSGEPLALGDHRHVVADRASGGGAQQGMAVRVVACHTADDGA